MSTSTGYVCKSKLKVLHSVACRPRTFSPQMAGSCSLSSSHAHCSFGLLCHKEDATVNSRCTVVAFMVHAIQQHTACAVYMHVKCACYHCISNSMWPAALPVLQQHKQGYALLSLMCVYQLLCWLLWLSLASYALFSAGVLQFMHCEEPPWQL